MTDPQKMYDSVYFIIIQFISIIIYFVVPCMFLWDLDQFLLEYFIISGIIFIYLLVMIIAIY